MTSMPGMEMQGGWTMSMAWMRMPGQSWAGAAATFIGMWTVMMVAMMLPSLLPMLVGYRRLVGAAGVGGRRVEWLTVIVGLGYFSVWILSGLAAYPLGVALAAAEMWWPVLARAVPVLTGLVVIVAGVLQFSAWKARALACCRSAGVARMPGVDALAAWRHGMQSGLHCVRCCAGMTAILLVVGVMDLRAMALVTVAITAERLAPAGERIARFTGAAAVIMGTFLISL
jgi:predicted metal-binding membrane protein